MSPLLRRTITWLLAATAVFELWAGLFLIVDQKPDLIACFAGIGLLITGLMIVISVLFDAPAFMALLQVFTVSYQIILTILILTSLYFRMDDTFLLGIYFSSLLFFMIQSLLIREFICAAFLRIHGRDYENIDETV